MNGTVKIEVHVPRPRLAFLKQKMKDRFRPVLFVKTATRVFVVREPPREIIAPRQGRLNHRPRFELQTYATFTVYVSQSFYETPEILCVQLLQQEQHCLFLVERQ
jgi:hypothetical protein